RTRARRRVHGGRGRKAAPGGPPARLTQLLPPGRPAGGPDAGGGQSLLQRADPAVLTFPALFPTHTRARPCRRTAPDPASGVPRGRGPCRVDGRVRQHQPQPAPFRHRVGVRLPRRVALTPLRVMHPGRATTDTPHHRDAEDYVLTSTA